MYKAAIIGLGNIGMEYDVTSATHPEAHTMAYVLDEGFELVCAMDVQLSKAETLYRFSPETKFYTDIQGMFEAHSDIEIVSVCTPPQWHLQNLEYLIRHTAVPYIFCEKPLILSLAELPRLKALLDFREITIVPNLSRRWNPGIQSMRDKIVSQHYGTLQKVMIRYTRGIYNTGAHLFDLLHWCGIKPAKVKVLDKVYTSSEREGESTFSFVFHGANDVRGYAEAFDDTQYYFFDIDFYFSNGKIAFRNSGDDIFYYSVGEHHLFPQFPELRVETHTCDVLSDSCLAHAIKDWRKIMNREASPRCSWQDAIYSLCVANALEKSYGKGDWVSVQDIEELVSCDRGRLISH